MTDYASDLIQPMYNENLNDNPIYDGKCNIFNPLTLLP